MPKYGGFRSAEQVVFMACFVLDQIKIQSVVERAVGVMSCYQLVIQIPYQIPEHLHLCMNILSVGIQIPEHLHLRMNTSCRKKKT